MPSLSAAARAPAKSREAIAVISPEPQCFIAGMNLVCANFDVPRIPQRTLITSLSPPLIRYSACNDPTAGCPPLPILAPRRADQFPICTRVAHSRAGIRRPDVGFRLAAAVFVVNLDGTNS